MSATSIELKDLRGYHYRLWNYSPSHSVLTIRAVHPNVRYHNIHITFRNVIYLQAPVSWDSDFIVCTDLEKMELLRKTTASPELMQQHVSVYKAETPQSTVYVIGELVDIEKDVEPIFET